MNCREALVHARKLLEKSSIENSSLEGEILLRHTLGISRATFFTELDKELSPEQLKQLNDLVKRRISGEPSSYITGHKEFYGLDFKVDSRVLIPRPETELLVEKAIALCRQYGFHTIADIGTGSGCIAVNLAVSIPDVTIYATDISAGALEVAVENCSIHGVKDRITFLHGNLLEALKAPVDMIIANLPYVRRKDIKSDFEPGLALDGGEDGLDKIKELCTQLRGKLKPGGILLLEIGQGQVDTVKTVLHDAFPAAVIEITRDLAGIDRVISLRLTA